MIYLALNSRERPGTLLWFCYCHHSPELRQGVLVARRET